jgi:hypothetical protein
MTVGPLKAGLAWRRSDDREPRLPSFNAARPWPIGAISGSAQACWEGC